MNIYHSRTVLMLSYLACKNINGNNEIRVLRLLLCSSGTIIIEKLINYTFEKKTQLKYQLCSRLITKM